MANESERLTPKQAEALRVELEELEGPRRVVVVAAIKTAREFGDLSENFEYHAAKNEQGLLEARIRTLRSRLDHATIVEEATGDIVSIGSIVEVDDESGSTMTVEISAVAAVQGLKPYLVGRNPAQLEQLRFLIANPTASLYNNRTQILAAIEFACIDVLGQLWGVPVHDILGGRLREIVGTHRREDPDDFARDG